jgi:hypothetical protein
MMYSELGDQKWSPFSFFAKIASPIIETYYLGGFYCESKRIHEKSDWSFL